MKIAGHYLNGKTSRRYPAFLEVGSDTSKVVHLRIDLGDDQSEQLYLSFEDLNIETRLGNTPREISFNDGQLFISENNDGIDNLIKLYRNSTSVLHTLESKSSLAVIASVVTIALVWAFVVYGIPASAKIIADKMPAFTSEHFGSSLSILDETLFEPSQLSPDKQQHIRDLVSPYIEKYKHLNATLYFRSGMGANALALPGGEIVLTDDFVNLTENDEQLLAVFFHELGHLKHKHITRRILQDSMITLMVIFITGDINTIDLVTGLPTLILDLSYSREFEIEADTYALKKMHKENIPLDNFSDIMLRLESFYTEDKPSINGDGALSDASDDTSDFDLPVFLSTHPATEERVKLTKQLILKYQDENID